MIDPVTGAKVPITGGTPGVGELYGRHAIAPGATSVSIWHIDGCRANALAFELSASGIPVRARRVDVSDLDVIAAIREEDAAWDLDGRAMGVSMDHFAGRSNGVSTTIKATIPLPSHFPPNPVLTRRFTPIVVQRRSRTQEAKLQGTRCGVCPLDKGSWCTRRP